MDGLRDHTELRKSEQDIYCMRIAYMWNQKKNDTNELIYKTVIRVRCRKQVYGYKGEVGEGQIGRLRLTYISLYTKEVTNKGLLYST